VTVALVTGGGRGIGANIARELAAEGMNVVCTARTLAEIDAVAGEIGGRAIEMDVASRESVERGFADAGPVDLLVANAGTGSRGVATGRIAQDAWEIDPGEWWRVFEVNVLGVHLCCRAAIPGMLERGTGRIVIVGSGAAYLPGGTETGYTASKAAVCRYGETLANALRDRIPVFVISPGLVRTAMTQGSLGDDAPWTPPECAPRLVAALATGEFDALAGRYLHAEHDPPEKLRERIDTILADDLNAIRLRR
jgi:NAD(P)-dependent dehydrogenase (short-subunit alcohol dehydrogenase family)